MNVTHASLFHAPALAALHRESFLKAWTEDEFRALLVQPGVAAWLWSDDAPRGFILMRAVADEAEIITLAVSPAHRRKGIAARLVKDALAALPDAKTVFLEVAADNAPAHALYESAGFAPCGKRPDYYADGRGATDAIVMRHALGGE